MPKKEDLETSIIKDYDQPAVPEPSSQVHTDVDDEDKKIQEEASCCAPSSVGNEPEQEPSVVVTEDDETVAASTVKTIPIEPVPVETAVVVEETTRPKTFMEKVDAFRDSCCGVVSLTATGSGSVATTTNKEVEVETPVVEEVTQVMEVPVADPEPEPPVVEEEGVEELREEEEEPVPPQPAPTPVAAKASNSNGNVFRSPNFQQRRKLKKKLREITAIEEKQAKGEELMQDQLDKLASKVEILAKLNAI